MPSSCCFSASLCLQSRFLRVFSLNGGGVLLFTLQCMLALSSPALCLRSLQHQHSFFTGGGIEDDVAWNEVAQIAAIASGAKGAFLCEDVDKHDFPVAAYKKVGVWLHGPGME